MPSDMNDLKTGTTPQGNEVRKPSHVKKTWSKPSVTEISRFSILSTAPTVSTTEGSTFRAKSA
jgi:hypothetical protein